MSNPQVNNTQYIALKDDDKEVILAAAAMAVSFVALGATLLQLLQQYVHTASGYTQCGQKVMGYWGKSRKLRVLWKQGRLEVKFETPLIFVCKPDNTRFPIPNERPYFIDGDKKAVREDLCKRWVMATWWYYFFGWWMEWRERRNGLPTARGKKNRKEPDEPAKGISTAQAELTSWVRLYEGLQDMEKVSQTWQKTVLAKSTSLAANDFTQPPDQAMKKRTLMVAMQPYDRSWDMMPVSLNKPIATTTMCHIVELLALLNVHWFEFDRSRDRYRAEGNGYVVTGQKLQELGICFSLNTYGKNRFEENRVIPDDGIKDLCFGRVYTIYSDTIDPSRLEAGEAQNMGAMQLSTDQEIAETLRVIGCNNNTVNIFEKGKRTAHIFPFAFELVGMLARMFHIEDTLFRFLPNPTKFLWDRRSFSMPELFFTYQELLSFEKASGITLSPIQERILTILGNMEPYLWRMSERNENRVINQPPEPPFISLLHKTLDEIDNVLNRKDNNKKSTDDEKGTAKKGNESTEQQERRKMVRDVIRSHVQAVLNSLNKEEEDARTPRFNNGSFTMDFRDNGVIAVIDAIDNAPPEGERNKQRLLMQFYFDYIRKTVCDEARGTTEDRKKALSNTNRFDLPEVEDMYRLPVPRPTFGPHGHRGSGGGAGGAGYDDFFTPPKLQRTFTLPTKSSGVNLDFFSKDFRRFEEKLEKLERFVAKPLLDLKPKLEDKLSELRPPRGESSRLRFSDEVTRDGQSEPMDGRPQSRGRDRDRPLGLTRAGPLPRSPQGLDDKATTSAGSTSGSTSTSRDFARKRVMIEDERETATTPEPKAEEKSAGKAVEAKPQATRRAAAVEPSKEAATAATATTVPSVAAGIENLGDLENVTHDDIWCVLIFRMMCWLTLHEFHRKDRQLPNSELLGSRLPVFIA